MWLSGRCHRLTFAVDLDERKQRHCELDDAAGATARVQIVNGK